MTSEKSLNRAALVYPNIHISDKNWLKATLLCFPSVVRMHPDGYKPRDYNIVGEFTSERNKFGKPLLYSEYINVLDKDSHQSPAYEAQKMMAAVLNENLDEIKKEYSPDPTTNRFPDGVEPYEIHIEKIEPPFYEFLLGERLAYQKEPPQQRPYYDRTLCLHPRLGDAIMTVTAISVANARGYDIVTDSTSYHMAVASLNERAVLDQLLKRPPQRVSEDLAERGDELAQAVIRTQFDVSRLTASQIVELNESEEFVAFKDAMIPLVERMPRMDSGSARKDYYETLANEVVKKWQATRKLISKRTGVALIEAAEIKAPDFASKLVGAGLATWVCNPIGSAIFAGVLLIKVPQVYQKWREGEVSFRYLTKVEQAGALLAGGAIGAFAGNPEYGSRVAH